MFLSQGLFGTPSGSASSSGLFLDEEQFAKELKLGLAANAFDWYAGQAYFTRHAELIRAAETKLSRLVELLASTGPDGEFVGDVLASSWGAAARHINSDRFRTSRERANAQCGIYELILEYDPSQLDTLCKKHFNEWRFPVMSLEWVDASRGHPAAAELATGDLSAPGYDAVYESCHSEVVNEGVPPGGQPFEYLLLLFRSALLDAFLANIGCVACLRLYDWRFTPVFHLGYLLDQVARPSGFWRHLYRPRATSLADVLDSEDLDGDEPQPNPEDSRTPSYLGNRVLKPGQLPIVKRWGTAISKVWREAFGQPLAPARSFRSFLARNPMEHDSSTRPSDRRLAYRSYLIGLAVSVHHQLRAQAAQDLKAVAMGDLVSNASDSFPVRRLPLRIGSTGRTVLTSNPSDEPIDFGGQRIPFELLKLLIDSNGRCSVRALMSRAKELSRKTAVRAKSPKALHRFYMRVIRKHLAPYGLNVVLNVVREEHRKEEYRELIEGSAQHPGVS